MNFYIETYKLVFVNTVFTLHNVLIVTLQTEMLAFNTEPRKTCYLKYQNKLSLSYCSFKASIKTFFSD